jgi:hypothetical protein
VWLVVCLAALAAMDSGRRRTVALSIGPAEPPPYPPAIIAGSGLFAVCRFWYLLADFAGLGRIPARWQQSCPAGHPFLSYDPATRSWAVDRPAFAPATPEQ